MTLAKDIARALGNGKEQKTGAGWLTLSPVHGDKKPSLSVNDTTYKNGTSDLIVNCLI